MNKEFWEIVMIRFDNNTPTWTRTLLIRKANIRGNIDLRQVAIDEVKKHILLEAKEDLYATRFDRSIYRVNYYIQGNTLRMPDMNGGTVYRWFIIE